MDRVGRPVLRAHENLYHLAQREDWRQAQAEGEYRVSTVGRTLAEEGFVHCSFREQLQGVADRFYWGRDDVVMLVIDPDRLGAEVRVEAIGPGLEGFPHVYGPIPVMAVRETVLISPATDGRLELPD